MACKYLYIDDADTEKALGTITGLQKKDILEINHILPKGEWNNEIKSIIDDVKDYNGLILDQRLDQGKSANGEHSHYRGTSVAQEIRVLVKEKQLDDLPIVLLSAEANISGSLDSTGADLFDHIVSKEHVGSVFEETGNILLGLCEGYHLLSKLDRTKQENGLLMLLESSESEIKTLDQRFVSKMLSLMSSPSHLISNFIIHNLLKQDGILITEALLAARLGIDLGKSKHWDRVLEILEDCKYTGVFNQGWKRWWMNRVMDWWDGISPDLDLRTLPAEARIKLIREKTGIEDLVPLTTIEYAKSSLFWVICQGTKQPIDTTDGLLIADQDDLFPWQERKYVSYYAALNRDNADQWKNVSVLEESKLTILQKIFKKERVRR